MVAMHGINFALAIYQKNLHLVSLKSCNIVKQLDDNLWVSLLHYPRYKPVTRAIGHPKMDDHSQGIPHPHVH